MPIVHLDRGHAGIRCPGCNHTHHMNVDASKGRPAWGFNGDIERPTFTPSLLVTSGHHVQGQPQPPNCFHCNEPDAVGQITCYRCHSFITDGQIQFLGDSTHALAGQTVPLPEFKWHSDGVDDATS